MNCGSNAGDISYTYGGGERCGKRLKVRDIAFIIRIVSFTGHSVEWRNHIFSVDDEGLIHEEVETVENTPLLGETRVKEDNKEHIRTTECYSVVNEKLGVPSEC